MKCNWRLLLLLLVFIIQSYTAAYSQGKNKSGNIYLQPNIGFSRGLHWGNESYPHEVNVSGGGKGIPTWSYVTGINFVHMVTNKFFYSGGLQYFNRKDHTQANADSLFSNYPFNTTPVIERKINYHNIECPAMFGIRTGNFSFKGGFTFIFLNFPTEYYKQYPLNDTQKLKHGGGFTFKIYPGIQAQYYFGKKERFSAFLGVDSRYLQIFQSKMFDVNAGIAYSFSLLKN